MPRMEIVSSRKQERLLPDATTRAEYVVWIKTNKGATGSEVVPADVWESEGLKQHLLDAADRLDKALLIDFD